MATTVAEQAATIHTLPKAWGESAGLQPSLADMDTKLQTYADLVREDRGSLLADIDGKLKLHAEETRVVQTSLIAEQEKEREERAGRRLNLRLAGLDEVAGEDTQSMVKEFLQDVLKVATPRITYAARVGRSDRGTRTILLKFASVEDRAVVLGNQGMLKGQTWECSEENLVDLPGFVRKASVWNSKRYVKGRGYGGLVVWAREGLMMEVEVAHLDPRKQFVSIRLNERGSISFLVFAYFAPSGSHVYRNLEGEETFLGITNELIKLRDVGPTWILGDFNSRICELQGLGSIEEEVVFESGPVGEDWIRVSEDQSHNTRRDEFLKFINTCGLTIVNGTKRFEDTSGFTCVTARGGSVVDFLLASPGARDRIASFCIEPLTPESDHRALFCTLEGFRRGGIQKRRRKVEWCINKEHCDRYEEVLASRLEADISPQQLSAVIGQTAQDVLLKAKPRRQAWFDEACRKERLKAMACTHEERPTAFRAYKNFIRGKKRSFYREQQVILTREFMKDPQMFWKRLSTRPVESELAVEDLIRYVTDLYFFPSGDRMPPACVPACSFSDDEAAGVFLYWRLIKHGDEGNFVSAFSGRRFSWSAGGSPPSMDDRDIEEELKQLFGQEENWSIESVLDQEDNWEELVLSEVSIPATTLSPDDLFSILDQAGVLRTPSATEDRIREDFDLPEEASVDEWSVLKTHQVVLVRDLSVTGRIAYKVESTPLEQDELGFHAIPVSKLWSGGWAPSYANFGALLGGEDGMFRAGSRLVRAVGGIKTLW
ncbi:hypothetical protein R1sor_014128 [Riccia sorocarpa]|uniref:Endonuclease/exonuclease/phosphatase domain-containing protein n=1 Tax=Riccia sorocarpa TaxID=122646 RepID=A0ABD3HCD7_9MARC